jgi:hypothetical protein
VVSRPQFLTGHRWHRLDIDSKHRRESLSTCIRQSETGRSTHGRAAFSTFSALPSHQNELSLVTKPPKKGLGMTVKGAKDAIAADG